MNEQWQLSELFKEAPEKAEELRIDRKGLFYWCDAGKSTYTKGVIEGDYSTLPPEQIYSALSSDRIVALRQRPKVAESAPEARVPMAVEELARRLDISVERVEEALISLKLKGLVESVTP